MNFILGKNLKTFNMSCKLLCICVTCSLFFLLPSSFGASLSDGREAITDPSLKPILTVNHWASSIWDSFSSKVRLGWDHVANSTISTFDKVSTGVKGSWEHLTNKTTPTLEIVSSKIQDGWGVVANGTTTAFQKVSTQMQNGWEVVVNGTIATYDTAASRICFIFNNLFCPSRIKENKGETKPGTTTIIPSTTTTIPSTTTTIPSTTTTLPLKMEESIVMAGDAWLSSKHTFNDSKTIQELSCNVIRVISIIGISMAGGLGVAIILHFIFFRMVYALGFTENGVLLGSRAAVCQSRTKNIAAGSWFAICQSVEAVGLKGMYKDWIVILIIWIFACSIIGYLIWPENP